MTGDHYAVLGVSPTSEDVVIQAAYRALMRRYHPDADPSIEAAQRAQAINAAYAVLGDAEKRARYDGSLAAQRLIKPDILNPRGLFGRTLPGPALMIALSAIAVVAVLMVIWPPAGMYPEDAAPLSAELHGERTDQPAPRPDPRDRRPVDDVDAVAPPIAVPASKEVPNAMLEPPEEIVTSDVREGSTVRTSSDDLSPKKQTSSGVAPKAAAVKPAVGAMDIKSDCVLGTGWADLMICNSSNLTALDRQSGLLYSQSWARADDGRRAALLSSRGRFQERRNACRSESCLTNTYIDRLREISDIMAQSSQQ